MLSAVFVGQVLSHRLRWSDSRWDEGEVYYSRIAQDSRSFNKIGCIQENFPM
jgi:hypothetical protein